jgi:membrane-associated phospholipid phosphatase
MRTRLIPLTIPLILLAACSEEPSAPSETKVESPAALVGGAPKFWETGAAVAWNELADRLLARRPSNALRVDVYLALAQLRAAEAAQAGTQPHPPVSAAIGGASVAVLSVFFPLDIAELEAALDAQEAADPWPGDKHENFAAGEAIGRAIGARVNTFAQSDQVGLTDPGLPPVGPGFWIPNGAPVRGFLGARTFYISSTDELPLPPPPAFGSARFNADLAEVRHISDTRTAEQVAIAVFWHVNQSPTSNAAWNALARELIVKYRKSDAEAARILFLAYSAFWDGIVCSFGGKYTYWLIRPSQADPAITLPISLPNHPSYPSNHATVDGALAGILEAAFPNERRRLEEVAEEAAVSRLYGGIHYRFDMVAGLALGRAAAAKALAADLATVAPLP